MAITIAQASNLPRIVAIYNAAIPAYMATADRAPVTVAARKARFSDFDATRRPLWTFRNVPDGALVGWLSLRSFYGRAVYDATVEVGVCTAPTVRRRGVATTLLAHARAAAPGLRVKTAP